MNFLKVFLLIFCIVLCSADVLGPEKDKQGKEDEKDDSSEAVDNDQIDAEYLKDIKKVVNLQVQLQELKDYMAAVREAKKATLKAQKELAGIKEDSDTEPDETATIFLEELKNMKKIVDEIKPGWLENIIEFPRNKMEAVEENPQEILDKLPPLPEDTDPVLSGEEQEVKEMFEMAMTELSHRPPDLSDAILMIQQAAEKGYIPARIKIAWSYLFGEGVEMDFNKAKSIFEELVVTGNADAHAGLGFMYAMGFGVPVSQAKALVHYTMGALGDSTFAQMALAYRHWAGVTVPNSCPKALDLYMKVAAKVAGAVSLSGGPAIQRVRLLDEAEGAAAGGALDTDLIEYYQLLAEKGDVQAQVGLGQLHFQGGRGVTLDINKALRYFQQAAKAGNAVANAFLGKIYLEGGDGIKADNETALRYFRKAAELNNPVGQAGLGLMYLQGRVVPKDTSTAFKYFTLAANQGWVEGQLHLGFMYFGGVGVRRDFKQANKYFSLASQSGHVLAFYHLGQMHAQGLGVLRSCTTAVELFKNVCERGKWGERLMLAHGAWRARHVDQALVQYTSMAEAGYEVAQSNAAYLLDTGEVTLFNETERWARALQLWSRAAFQGYSPARVKLGDYHYYGLGTQVDYETSAYHYRIASEQQLNAQATFNLGYMHELGLGLAKDLHLAKRCYDLATHMSPDARIPVALALAKLNIVIALSGFKESPFGMIFLGGESTLLSNWDLYLISVLFGALGLVIYFRRPRPQPAN